MLPGFDVLNTLYMHLIIISHKYNIKVRKKKKRKQDSFSCRVARRNLYFKTSRHFRNYPSFPACTAKWNRVYSLYADGPNRKLAPLASREITSPQWLVQSKTAFWDRERYWVHAWIVKMNKEFNREKINKKWGL